MANLGIVNKDESGRFWLHIGGGISLLVPTQKETPDGT